MVRFSSLDDGKTRASLLNRRKKRDHDVSFGTAKPMKLTTELATMRAHGSKRYGFRISHPRYRLGMRLAEGVRLDLAAGHKGWTRRFKTTLWLPRRTIAFGAQVAAPHDGTRPGLEAEPGLKRFATPQR